MLCPREDREAFLIIISNRDKMINVHAVLPTQKCLLQMGSELNINYERFLNSEYKVKST